MTKFLLHIPLLVGLLLVPGLAWADFQAGVDAANRGDYENALAEFRALAEQGDVSARSVLGALYIKGQGVPQDYQEAVKWYRLAAEGLMVSNEREKSLAGKREWVVSGKCRISLMVANPLTCVMKRRRTPHV